MHEKSLSVLAGWCGLIGGLFKYTFLQMQPSFLVNLIQAGVTALCCGALGVAGKEAYGIAKKIIIYKLDKRRERIKRQGKGEDTKVV